MHSLNCSSPAKYQGKTVNVINNTDKNAPEIFGKPSKSKVISSTSLNFKDSKLGSATKSQKFTNINKRKDEKRDVPVQKRIKSDSLSSVKNSLDDVKIKPPVKFKSQCPKTYICKFCCRRFYTEEQLQQHSKSHGNKSSHICYLCSYQTVSFSALMNHYLKHSGSKESKLEKIFTKSKADFTNVSFNLSSKTKPAFNCPNCKLSFNLKSKFDAHKCPFGLAKDVYTCAYCGRISSSVEEYRNCVQSHTETPFVCSNCKAKFQRKKQLDVHLESCKGNVKSNKDLKCEKCLIFTCNSVKELAAHLKICKSSVQSFTCKNCSSEFLEKKIFDEHLMQCEILHREKSGSFKSETLEKKPRKYVKRKVKYNCSSCKAPFFLKSEYKRHEKSCSTVIPYDANESVSRTCSKCGELIRIGKFAEHVKVCSNKLKTVDKTVSMVENDISSEKTAGMNNLNTSEHDSCADQIDNVNEEQKIHVKHRVKSQTTYSPDEKDVKESVVENDIDVHKQISTVDDSHGARRSTRLVRRKSSFIDEEEECVQKKKRKTVKMKIPKKARVMIKPKFRRGKYTNESNKSFLCNICDFAFCSKSTLLRHKRMHSGNPWYTCKYCGKFFFRKDVYIRHEMNVHKDNTKTMYCCCYCKLCYKDSLSLKDHVMEVHKDSAFLPIRPRFFSKRNSNAVEVKQEAKDLESDDVCNVNEMELDEKDVAKDAVSSFFTDPSYKCSVCFKTFETASETVIHMGTHSKSGDDNYTTKAVKTDVKHATVHGSKLSKTSTLETTDTESTKLVENSKNQRDAANVQSNPAMDELITDENLINLDQYEKLECLLCLKKFSDKALFEAHGKTAHKLVEWYQCLVCSASGPKQDMLEHMFSHMFKVGSFIVNSNSKNFDTIVPCLEREKTVNKASRDTENAVTVPTDESEFVSELELPPLREYGLCLCMKSKMAGTQEDENTQTEENLDNLLPCLTLPNEVNSNESEINIAECHDVCDVAITNNESEINSENLLEDETRNLQKFNAALSIVNEANNNEKHTFEKLFSVDPDINDEKMCTSDFSTLQDEEKCSTESLNISTIKESVKSNELDSSVSPSDKVSKRENVDVTDNSQDTDEDKVVSSSDSSSSEDEESVAGPSSNTSEKEETKNVEIHPSSEDDENQSNSSSNDSSSSSEEGNETDDKDVNSNDVSSSEEGETGVTPSDVSSSEEEITESRMMISSEPSLLKKEEKIEKMSSFDIPSAEKKADSGDEVSSNKLFVSSKNEKAEVINTSKLFYSRIAFCDAEKLSPSSVYSSAENKRSSEGPQLSAEKGKKEVEFNTSKVLYSSAASDVRKLLAPSVYSTENKGNSKLSPEDKDKKEAECNSSKILYSKSADPGVGKLSASSVSSSAENKGTSEGSQLLSVEKDQRKAEFNTSKVLFFSKSAAADVGESVSSVYSSENKGNSEDPQPSLAEEGKKETEFIKPSTSSYAGNNIVEHLYAPYSAENKTDLSKCVISTSVGNRKDILSSPIVHSTDKEAKGLELTKPIVSSSVGGSKETDFSLLNILFAEEKEVKTKETVPSNIFSPEKTKNQTNLSGTSCSSQVNELLNLQPNKGVNDFQSESFSQLRYLLQKPSKMEPEKITIYPLSHTDSSISQGNSNPFVKCVTSMENQTLFDSNFLLGNACDFSLANLNNSSINKMKYETQTPPNVNQNTCLKLDINQSRSEVSSNIPPSTSTSKSSDRTENLFKPCSIQSPILDFSDLIQHSFENSSPSEENIFSYSDPVKTDLQNCREEIRTPDCTVMDNFDSPAFGMDAKCSNCHIVLENSNELASHKCLPTKTVKYVDPLFSYKPKNTFQSPDYFENQKKVTSVITQNFQEKYSVPTIHKPAESYVAAKVLPLEMETKKHCKSIPHQNAQIPPQSSSKCNKCQRTFTDIGELMKHSLSCLKPLFYRNTHVNDSMTATGTLHSLLLKEPVTSFSAFSLNSSVPVTTVTSGSTISHQNFENIKHSFDS